MIVRVRVTRSSTDERLTFLFLSRAAFALIRSFHSDQLKQQVSVEMNQLPATPTINEYNNGWQTLSVLRASK